MCLVKDMKATQKFSKKNRNKKKLVVWKLYKVLSGGVVYPIIFDNEPVKAGWIKSDRQSKSKDDQDYPYREWCDVNRGIHVYLSRQQARVMRDICDYEQIFRCTANVSDLVGIDDRQKEAVFMKIHITKEEFERGKKGRNN